MIASSALTLAVVLFLHSIADNSFRESLATLVENATAQSDQEQTNVGLSTRIKIPSISVDAPVEDVGRMSNGAMAAPRGPDKAAWFMLGPRPGENGSAVIAGHSGWNNDIAAAFDNLYALRKGDKIFIENEKGEKIIFVVREIRIYGKDEAASDVFSSSDGKSHLNLITCAGVWNETDKTRSERLVVFTDKE